MYWHTRVVPWDKRAAEKLAPEPHGHASGTLCPVWLPDLVTDRVAIWSSVVAALFGGDYRVHRDPASLPVG